MENSIYDQIQKHLDDYAIINQELENTVPENANELIDVRPYDLDSAKVLFEIDIFVRENPDIYKKHLISFQSKFENVRKRICTYVLENEEAVHKKYDGNSHIALILASHLRKIKNYLTELLNPETEIQEQPQKFEKLLPIEKILILHYLKFEGSSLKYTLAEKEFTLSRLFDIKEGSIKNPLSKVRDYTEYHVDPKPAEQYFPRLQKVKLFFDESKRYEISKVIETRINELKKIAGKD